MIDTANFETLKQIPVAERIRMIEFILKSLKKDINMPPKTVKKQTRTFRVRKFSLGKEVHVDREEMYADRGR
ncbi:MAG: hypothetical protein GY765_31885 [bacterium]|nr:hypothetical protein [bacterium]